MKFSKLSLTSGLATLSLMSSYAYACSSCGSSATTPLVLNPNENLKAYLGISQNFGYMNYKNSDSQGAIRTTNPKLITRRTLTLAVGYRLTDDAFVTLTGTLNQSEGPININDLTQGNKVKYVLGDPILSGRYNLVNMGIDNVYRPQVQLVASYKPKLAKNMVDLDGDAIDTVGNGFHQVMGGIDFWWGMSWLQFGASQLLTYSFDRTPDNVNAKGETQYKRTRDLQYTTVLTLGHVLKEYKLAFQTGVILDYIGEETTYRRNDAAGYSTKNVNPTQQSNSVFFLVKYNVTEQDTLRFSYTIGGAYDGNLGPFTNSNQTTSNSALVAYEKTFF